MKHIERQCVIRLVSKHGLNGVFLLEHICVLHGTHLPARGMWYSIFNMKRYLPVFGALVLFALLVFFIGNFFVNRYEHKARREFQSNIYFMTEMIQNRFVPYLGIENDKDLLNVIAKEIMDENNEVMCIAVYDSLEQPYFVMKKKDFCAGGRLPGRGASYYPYIQSVRKNGKDIVSVYQTAEDIFNHRYYILYIFETGIFSPLYSLRLYFNLLFALFLMAEVVLVYITRKTDRNLSRLREMLISAEQSFIVDRLAGLLAHELKNPLFVLSGNIELSGLSMEEKETLLNEIKRMRGIIERYETVFRKQAAPITALIEAREYLLRLFKVQFERKGLSINFELKSSYNLKMPFDDFKQIALNIIINALQAKASMNIKVEDNEKYVKMFFCSEGERIQREIEKRVFEPYFTTKKEGTGLGLFISKMLAEKNSGRLYYRYKRGFNCFILEVLKHENTDN